MADAETQSQPKAQWVGKLLAVLLTAAIVVVVFWQAFPGGERPQSDISGNPTTNYQQAEMEQVGESMWRAYAGPAVVIVTGSPANNFEFRMRMFMLLDEDTRTLIRAYRTVT